MNSDNIYRMANCFEIAAAVVAVLAGMVVRGPDLDPACETGLIVADDNAFLSTALDAGG